MKVISVNVGEAQQYHIDGRRVASAIGKRSVPGPVALHPLGLEGDVQVNLDVHGGVDKAVYAYPVEHYAWWLEQRLAHLPAGTLRSTIAAMPWGFMGENLSVSALLESQVFVGDVLHLPNCTLRVTQARQPCFKFAHVMGFAHAPKLMAQSNRCGYYLSVVRGGAIRAEEHITLEKGPNHGLADFRIALSRPPT